MLFLYHNESIAKIWKSLPCLMSLHPGNIEPSEGTMYLTCSLAWLGKG